MKHTNKNTRLAAIKWWKSLDNFSRNEVISKYVRGAKFLGRTLSSLTGRECEELYLSMTPATPYPLPETGKKVMTRNGEVLPMNETETEVFHFGTWKEIQEDQDGGVYFLLNGKAVYIEYPNQIPETETGVSIDTPTEAEDWELYPGNEAGEYDHLDNAAEGLEIEELEKALFDGTTGTPPTPGNERQEWEGFTGGEWVIEERNDKIFIEGVGNDGVEPFAVEICQMHGTEEIDKRDARLICQSKAMYRALKKWLEVINRSPAALHHYGEAISETEAILNSITGGK